MDRVENGARQDGKRRAPEGFVRNVARHDPVVLAHPLDHQFLDQAADAECELVERVGARGADHPVVATGARLDLFEEEPVFFHELGPEPLVQYLDDLRQRGLFVPGGAGADVARGFERLRLALPDSDGAGGYPLQAVVLQRHVVAGLDDRAVAAGRQVRQQQAPEAVQHLQFGVGVGNDLAQVGVRLHERG